MKPICFNLKHQHIKRNKLCIEYYYYVPKGEQNNKKHLSYKVTIIDDHKQSGDASHIS